MKKIAFILFACMAFTLNVCAQQPARVPARPGVIERVQPNGDTLHVFLRGDERHHFMMTVDGWQVMEDKKGKICYCKLKQRKIKGEGMRALPARTCRTAHDATKRSKCEQRWLEKHGIQKIKKD